MLLRQPALPRHDAGAQAALIPMTQGRGQPADDAPAPPARRPDWGVQAHWPALAALLPGLDVEVLASVGSTNTVLLERLRTVDARRGAGTTLGRRSGDRNPCLLVAERQTAGRGRRGRSWQSAPGASLTFSLALPLAPASWSGLSLAVGVALADALDPPAGSVPPRIGLKWPNDLWLGDAPGRGRKLGGVLIETAPVGDARVAVIGVGLNVQPLADAAGFATGYGCLQELLPGIDAPAVLWRVALPLAQALRRFEREGFAAFAAAYGRRDLLAGQTVRTTDPAVPEGLAEGVDGDGALRVRAGGVLHKLVGGEVSVRPAGG